MTAGCPTLAGVARGGTRATELLAREGITHAVHRYEHEPRHSSYGLEAAAALGVQPERVFKTLIAEVDGNLAVAVVPVAATLDLKSLAEAVAGKRARMAGPAAAERATGYVTGGISPLGQRRLLPTVIDSSALGFSTIFCSGGQRGLQIELAPADLARASSAAIAPIARPR